MNILMKRILQVNLSSVPPQEQLDPHLQRQAVLEKINLGVRTMDSKHCTSAQVCVTNSHAFLSISCQSQGNDYSISPF